jgi:hypothetical protein
MHEYILAARPLNKPISLGPVEPLHYALLLHSPSPSSSMVSFYGEHNKGTVTCCSCLFCSQETKIRVYPSPETARAADASEGVALRQLDVISELGLCFPNTKTSNAMAFLDLQRCASRRTVLLLWQEVTSKARRKFTSVPQGNHC